MRKRFPQSLSIALAVVILLTIAACSQATQVPERNDIAIVGSGHLVSRERAVSDFDSLEAGLVFDLSIRQGEAFGVVFVADDNLVDYVTAEKTGKKLSFGLIDGYAYNISNATMRVELTVPDLAGLTLNGSSRATLEDFRPDALFEATLTGSSFLGGELTAENVNLDVDGNSRAQLSGSSDHLRLEGCGNSMADLSAFQVNDAELDMACASTAIVQVDNRLDAEAAQHARILYVNRPAAGEINTYQSAYVGQK